jgi:uncharacterized protein (TIGR03435 family)
MSGRAERRRLFLATICVAALVLLVVASALTAPRLQAQAPASPPRMTQWQIDAGGKMAFDVASVKPSEPGSSRGGNVSMAEGDYVKPTEGLFIARNFPLFAYIEFAYNLPRDHEQEQLLLDSLPKWAATQMFTVEARASFGNPTKDQYRLMMQSLLVDRFKLAFHIEQRKVPVFALALVKPGTLGPNLRLHSNGPPCNVPASENGSVPSSDSGTPAVFSDSFPFNCGVFNLLVRPNNMLLTGSRDATIAALAMWLAGLHAADLGRPVADQTGLDGRFDFSLKWSFVPPNSSPADATNQPELLGLTIQDALKEQLGLKLEPTTGPVDVLVVDHVEQPSPN